jgi:DNA-binding transcriptional LysR family regulator
LQKEEALCVDIKNLECFIEIVNSNFSLSAAAKKLGISQPSLSYMIKNFETEENIMLFERYSGRLQNLTASGEVFYRNALVVLENHQTMMDEMRSASARHKGRIKIGIPPLILGVALADIISAMVIKHQDITFDIIEMGAYELKKSLLAKKLDFAILLQPTDISSDIVTEHLLTQCELSAFMSAYNPLAKEEHLHWGQLDGKLLAIFNNTFMIHHQLVDRFEAEQIHPKIPITSSCWDYLLLSTKNSNLITILPSPIGDLITRTDIVEIPFYDPIPWMIVLCQAKKTRYRYLEKYVLQTILNYFNQTPP